MQKQVWKRTSFILGTLLSALLWYGFLEMTSHAREGYAIVEHPNQRSPVITESRVKATTQHPVVVTDPTTFPRIEVKDPTTFHRIAVTDPTTFSRNEKPNSKTLLTENQVDGVKKSFFESTPLSTKLCVVLNAGYRTGSSFAGEFFNRHMDFMYLFEPLQNFQLPNLMPSTETVTEVLGKLFTCNATGSFMGGLTHRVGWNRAVIFGLYSNQSKFNNHLSVRDRSKAFDKIYPNLCHTRSHHAAKVIRVKNITLLEPLMQKGVKVVTLVRDPRGTYWSRRAYKSYGKSREEDIIRYCAGKYQDALRYKHLYKIYGHDISDAMVFIRYEDLATNPDLSLTNLYNFLGIEPDDNLRQWVQENEDRNQLDENSSNITYSSDRGGSVLGQGENRMGTFRQRPSFTAVSWRQTMPMKDVQTVQKHCRGFMAEFGYKQFYVEKKMRNLDLPSFTTLDLLGEVDND